MCADHADPDSIKMFVGQIPRNWTEDELRDYFSEFGPIHQLTVLLEKGTGQSKGCCFITYMTRKSALDAETILHNKRFMPGMNFPVQIRPADCENKTERKLFVGCLSRKMTEEDVRKMFEPFEVEDCVILRDASGNSKGCAFITLASHQSCMNAITCLNGSQTMEGSVSALVVKFAETQRERDLKRQQHKLSGLLNMGPVGINPQFFAALQASGFPGMHGGVNNLQQLLSLVAAQAAGIPNPGFPIRPPGRPPPKPKHPAGVPSSHRQAAKSLRRMIPVPPKKKNSFLPRAARNRGTITSIPGLSVPADDASTSSAENKTLELLSFSGHSFLVPEAHRFGRCQLISDFDKLGSLGEGAYGIVYKGRDKKRDEIVALKKMKIGKENQCLPINFTREINILKSLNHNNIVNMHGIAVGMLFESTYLILEYCPYELCKVVDDNEAKMFLCQPQIKCIMQQLFTGLDYIHQHYVLHRDLTVANILFTATGVLKISDFGLARLNAETDMTPDVVTRWYRAPELLFGATEYSSAIDIWSAGCILAELLLKEPLFKTESDNGVIALIIDLLGTPTESIWPGMSKLPLLESYDLVIQPYNKLGIRFEDQPKTCSALLHKLFFYNPEKRITAERCLSHIYFADKPDPCDLETLVQLLKKSEEI